MQPGDHYITNDPWLGTGHLHDLTVVTPAFRDGRDRRRCSPTPRTSSTSAASAWGPKAARCSRKGSISRSSNASSRAAPNETFFDFIRAGIAPAGRAGGRHLFAVRLQRRRRQAAGRDDGRVRAWTASIRWPQFIFDSSLRATLAEIAQAAEGHLSRRDLVRRLRGADDAARRDDHPR